MMHRSKILIFLGIVLVLCSAGLFSHNMYVDYESRIKEEKIADDLIKKMGDNFNDDSAIDVDGTKYIGLLEIPKINVTLAVSRDYSFEQMSESLCRYSGSIEDKNIIICGHNYKSFLENLKDVFDNDVLYLDFGTYFLKNNSHYLFKNDVGQNIGNLLKNSTIQSKIDNGSKVYYIDCTSKGDNSNYLECVDSSIKLNKIYSPYPKEYIREFDIYEVQTANIS